MDMESAERIINENRGGIVIQAIITVLEDQLETCKRSLLRGDDQIVRGKGLFCDSFIAKLQRTYDEENIDTGQ